MDELLDDNIITSNDDIQYKVADKRLRFANYMVDYIILVIAVSLILVAFAILSGDHSLFDENKSSTLWEYVIGYIANIIYYTTCEFFFKGKTIGKLITKTRAVTLENEVMDFNTTLKRSLSRIVPFEAFSFLGNSPSGWHDRWTETKVILDKNWKEKF